MMRAQHAGFKFLRVPRFLACFRVHDKQKTAVMYDVGRDEMQRIRKQYLGYEPTHREVVKKVAPYLARQLVIHWMYSFGLVRF
jgi:hypothetical protein